MPLREDPDRLFLDVGHGGTDRWLLLESPETIDFVEEVTLALQRRSVRPALDGREVDRLGPLIEAALRKPVTRPVFDRRPVGLRFEFPRRPVIGGRETAEMSATVRGAYFIVTELATKTVRRVMATMLSPADRALLRGTVVYLDRFGHIVDWLIPDVVEWLGVALDLVQNGNGSKALLLPAAGAALSDGRYRLDLRIARPWFETLAPRGPDNTYLDQAGFEFDIVPA
jgi:hypothetical protein